MWTSLRLFLPVSDRVWHTHSFVKGDFRAGVVTSVVRCEAKTGVMRISLVWKGQQGALASAQGFNLIFQDGEGRAQLTPVCTGAAKRS